MNTSRVLRPAVVALWLAWLMVGSPTSQPTRAAGPWFVAPGGNDANSCLSPAAPCASINGAIGKATRGDTIYVAEGTYAGSGDQVVVIDKSLMLSGGWSSDFTTQIGTSIIDGQGLRRGVTVNSGVTAVVQYLTVQRGSGLETGGIYNEGALTLSHCTVITNTGYYAGGIRNHGSLNLISSSVGNNNGGGWGGGILNFQGNLTVEDSSVSGNSADEGGGIDNHYGTLTITTTVITENTARSGAGINHSSQQTLTVTSSIVVANRSDLDGGGINASGTSTLNASHVSGNTAGGNGGGIMNGGTMTLNNSTVDSNSAGAAPYWWRYGGGIYNRGTLTLNSSAVVSNTASAGGGGIDSFGRFGWYLALNNSTVSQNRTDGAGGGVRNEGAMTLSSSTISGNWAASGGGIYHTGIAGLSGSTVVDSGLRLGNGLQSDSDTATLRNTVLAANRASATGPDCIGAIASAGYNLLGSSIGCSLDAGVGDLLNLSPRLLPLNGSPDFHPLVPCSPAIDAGDPAGCTDPLGNPLTTDQRGASRPVDGDLDGTSRCDIGAFEYDPISDNGSCGFLPVILR